MNGLSRILRTVAAFLLVTCTVPWAGAADPPADVCSLLPVAVVSQMLKATYSGPDKSIAPRPFPNTAQGTDCTYKSSRHNLVFRIYVDSSVQEATDLFTKLKAWFGAGSTAVTNVGDEAYMDTNHGLHVRKGKVRYFLSGREATDQQLEGLGAGIAGQL